MKTRVQLYQVPGGSKLPEIPASLAMGRETVVYNITTYMRMFGISRLTITPIGMGLKTITNVSFKAMEGEPPEAYVHSRNFVLRNMADIMALFGVLDIEILPNEKEMEVIKEGWKAYQIGDLTNIKLNLEVDPSGESVLEDVSEE